MTKPRVYHIPGVSISLVREEGVRLSARPQIREPRSAAKLLAQYIGDRDRETFVVALLSVRHRVLAFNTVSVGCAIRRSSTHGKSSSRRSWPARRPSSCRTTIRAVTPNLAPRT